MKYHKYKDKKWNNNKIRARCGILGCLNEESGIPQREMFRISTGFVFAERSVRFKPFESPEWEDIYLCNKHKKEFAELTYNWQMMKTKECCCVKRGE